MMNNANVLPTLVDKRIEETEANRLLPECVFASVDTLAARLDVSRSTIEKLIREHKPQRFPIYGKAVRYRVMDIVRLFGGEPSTERS